jgi:hypothetical protein
MDRAIQAALRKGWVVEAIDRRLHVVGVSYAGSISPYVDCGKDDGIPAGDRAELTVWARMPGIGISKPIPMSRSLELQARATISVREAKRGSELSVVTSYVVTRYSSNPYAGVSEKQMQRLSEGETAAFDSKVGELVCTPTGAFSAEVLDLVLQ